MAESFQWVFELLDQVSSPAKAITSQIEKLNEKLKEANQHASKQLLKKFIEGFTIVEAVKGVGELTEKLIDLGVEFGKEVMKAADFERSATIAFTAMTGSDELAEAWLGQVDRFATGAGLKLQPVTRQFQAMRLAGFTDPGTVSKMMAAAYDIQAKSGGLRPAQGVLDMFADTMSMRRLTGRALAPLKGVIDMGDLGKQLGLKARDFKELQEALSSTNVSAATGIQAIIRVMAGAKNSVGDTQKQLGDGWEGALNRVSNAWEKALGAFSKTQQFRDIVDMANSFANSLKDPATAQTIKEVAMAIASIAKSLAAMLPNLAKFLSVSDSQAVSDNSATKMSDMMADFSKAKPNQGIWDTMFGESPNAWAERTGYWKTKGIDPSTLFNFTDGKGIDAAAKTGEAMAQANIAGFKGDKGIKARSPSKVYQQMGEFAADGFGLGMNGKMSRAIVLPGVGGGKSGAGASMNFTINASTTDAKGLGERARDVVASALAAAFEEIALESGAS